VRIYAGIDPVTKHRHYLTEIIPASAKAHEQAEVARTRLLNEINERRHPRTSATVGQLLDRYLEVFDGDRGTLQKYRGYLRKHIMPFIGQVKVGTLDADILDSLYAELRRCRTHCDGRGGIDHRTPRAHTCDERCHAHKCRPLAARTVRHMHFILSGAYKRAVRWRWVAVSPVSQAEPPSAPAADPQPPSPAEAARLLNAAWLDPDWGTFVWLAMTTGARRGELCALRWQHVDLDRRVVTLRRSIAQDDEGPREKDTKTHQRRHIALDPETAAVLTEHRQRCVTRARALGLELPQHAFVYSASPDGSKHLLPSSISQRYGRLAERLGIDTTLHKLRHYSATELIAAGVDIRTVAGRLGHAGGGATTLRVYSAWMSESDQRAATNLLARMPTRPASAPEASERAKTDPRSLYERIAADLRRQILDGALTEGQPVPPIKQIATTNDVAVSTAHRAVALLRTWGLVEVTTGRPTIVRRIDEPPTERHAAPVPVTATPLRGDRRGRAVLSLEVRHLGRLVRLLTVEADPGNTRDLRQILGVAVRRHGHNESEIADYEMDVRYANDPTLLTTFATLAE
jgi:integrase